MTHVVEDVSCTHRRESPGHALDSHRVVCKGSRPTGMPSPPPRVAAVTHDAGRVIGGMATCCTPSTCTEHRLPCACQLLTEYQLPAESVASRAEIVVLLELSETMNSSWLKLAWSRDAPAYPKLLPGGVITFKRRTCTCESELVPTNQLLQPVSRDGYEEVAHEVALGLAATHKTAREVCFGVATVNALTLADHGPAVALDGRLDCGRVGLLVRQLRERDILFDGVQETRRKDTEAWKHGGFGIWSSACEIALADA